MPNLYLENPESDLVVDIVKKWGYSHLKGHKLAKLSSDFLLAAANKWIKDLQEWTKEARTIYSCWLEKENNGGGEENEEEYSDGEEFLARFFNARNDMFALETALTEHNSTDKNLLAEGQRLSDELDTVLEYNIDVLAVLVGTQYWHNWRAMMGEPTPWWLGEKVEEAANHW